MCDSLVCIVAVFNLFCGPITHTVHIVEVGCVAAILDVIDVVLAAPLQSTEPQSVYEAVVFIKELWRTAMPSDEAASAPQLRSLPEFRGGTRPPLALVARCSHHSSCCQRVCTYAVRMHA